VVLEYGNTAKEAGGKGHTTTTSIRAVSVFVGEECVMQTIPPADVIARVDFNINPSYVVPASGKIQAKQTKGGKFETSYTMKGRYPCHMTVHWSNGLLQQLRRITGVKGLVLQPLTVEYRVSHKKQRRRRIVVQLPTAPAPMTNNKPSAKCQLDRKATVRYDADFDEGECAGSGWVVYKEDGSATVHAGNMFLLPCLPQHGIQRPSSPVMSSIVAAAVSIIRHGVANRLVGLRSVAIDYLHTLRAASKRSKAQVDCSHVPKRLPAAFGGSSDGGAFGGSSDGGLQPVGFKRQLSDEGKTLFAKIHEVGGVVGGVVGNQPAPRKEAEQEQHSAVVGRSGGDNTDDNDNGVYELLLGLAMCREAAGMYKQLLDGCTHKGRTEEQSEQSEQHELRSLPGIGGEYVGGGSFAGASPGPAVIPRTPTSTRPATTTTTSSSRSRPTQFFHVAIDCPGYGRTPGDCQTVRSYPGELLAQITQSLGKRRAYALVGSSQGCCSVFNAVLERPELTRFIAVKHPVGHDVTRYQAVRQPSLMIYDVDDLGHPVEVGRQAKRHLPNATYVEHSADAMGDYHERFMATLMLKMFDGPADHGLGLKAAKANSSKLPVLSKVAGGLDTWSHAHGREDPRLEAAEWQEYLNR
jgi:hypothetical protein